MAMEVAAAAERGRHGGLVVEAVVLGDGEAAGREGRGVEEERGGDGVRHGRERGGEACAHGEESEGRKNGGGGGGGWKMSTRTRVLP